jgi:hypothetical protein
VAFNSKLRLLFVQVPILTRLIIERIKVPIALDKREACDRVPVKMLAISRLSDAEEVLITKIQCVGVHREDLASESKSLPQPRMARSASFSCLAMDGV